MTSALQTIDGITCPNSQLDFTPFYFPICETSLVETFQLGPFGLTTLQAHFMLFSLFASIIGPFGGFFASGLKRSIKIKVKILFFRILRTQFPDMEEWVTEWIANLLWVHLFQFITKHSWKLHYLEVLHIYYRCWVHRSN